MPSGDLERFGASPCEAWHGAAMTQEGLAYAAHVDRGSISILKRACGDLGCARSSGCQAPSG